MHDAKSFVLFWAVNSLLFYFAPFVFSDIVVTGNARLAPFLASVISGFLLALSAAFVMPAMDFLKVRIKEEWQWILVFLGGNILTVWLIARYADLTGVGISNIWVALLLGAIANVVQWVVWKFTEAKLPKTK